LRIKKRVIKEQIPYAKRKEGILHASCTLELQKLVEEKAALKGVTKAEAVRKAVLDWVVSP
jgi:hypothetical protein